MHLRQTGERSELNFQLAALTSDQRGVLASSGRSIDLLERGMANVLSSLDALVSGCPKATVGVCARLSCLHATCMPRGAGASASDRHCTGGRSHEACMPRHSTAIKQQPLRMHAAALKHLLPSCRLQSTGWHVDAAITEPVALTHCLLLVQWSCTRLRTAATAFAPPRRQRLIAALEPKCVLRIALFEHGHARTQARLPSATPWRCECGRDHVCKALVTCVL